MTNLSEPVSENKTGFSHMKYGIRARIVEVEEIAASLGSLPI